MRDNGEERVDETSGVAQSAGIPEIPAVPDVPAGFDASDGAVPPEAGILPEGDVAQGGSGWQKTRTRIEMKAMLAAVQIGEAVGETGQAIQSEALDDAGRLRRLAALFRQGVVGFLLSLHLGATAVLSGVVFSNAFPYAYMYVLMGLLLWLVFAMRFMALRSRRYAAALRSGVVNLILTAFWTYVLLDQIPARPVVEGALRLRTEMYLLWISIGMYLVAQGGMVAHGIIDRSRRGSPH